MPVSRREINNVELDLSSVSFDLVTKMYAWISYDIQLYNFHDSKLKLNAFIFAFEIDISQYEGEQQNSCY